MVGATAIKLSSQVGQIITFPKNQNCVVQQIITVAGCKAGF